VSLVLPLVVLLALSPFALPFPVSVAAAGVGDGAALVAPPFSDVPLSLVELALELLLELPELPLPDFPFEVPFPELSFPDFPLTQVAFPAPLPLPQLPAVPCVADADAPGRPAVVGGTDGSAEGGWVFGAEGVTEPDEAC
jgi:hypothetical protein